MSEESFKEVFKDLDGHVLWKPIRAFLESMVTGKFS